MNLSCGFYFLYWILETGYWMPVIELQDIGYRILDTGQWMILHLMNICHMRGKIHSYSIF